MIVPFAWGVSVLTTYRLYRLDGAGKIMGADWVEADSDAAALREADARTGNGKYELWQRDRRVAFPGSPKA